METYNKHITRGGEVDTYNKHITKGFSDGLACSGERWTLITSTLRKASVMDKPVVERGGHL